MALNFAISPTVLLIFGATELIWYLSTLTQRYDVFFALKINIISLIIRDAKFRLASSSFLIRVKYYEVYVFNILNIEI